MEQLAVGHRCPLSVPPYTLPHRASLKAVVVQQVMEALHKASPRVGVGVVMAGLHCRVSPKVVEEEVMPGLPHHHPITLM